MSCCLDWIHFQAMNPGYLCDSALSPQTSSWFWQKAVHSEPGSDSVKGLFSFHCSMNIQVSGLM